MFRRIRARRARAAEKQSKQREKTRSIFRKAAARSPPPSIQPAITLGLSEDDTDRDSTVHESDSVCIISRNEMLSHVLHVTDGSHEIIKLQTAIDELKEAHQEEIVSKDNTIVRTKEELVQTKAELVKVDSKLAEVKRALCMKKLELNARKQDLIDKDFHISNVEFELKKTQKSLDETRAIVSQQGDLIEEQQKEISKQKKLIKYGKTSGKVVMGLLALGAMGSSEGGSLGSF